MMLSKQCCRDGDRAQLHHAFIDKRVGMGAVPRLSILGDMRGLSHYDRWVESKTLIFLIATYVSIEDTSIIVHGGKYL